MPRILIAMLLITVLSGCRQHPSARPQALSSPQTTPKSSVKPPPMTRRFASAKFGFHIDYPRAMQASTQFRVGYLLGDRWQAGPLGALPGDAIVELTLDGSNDVTRATLRIGASTDHEALSKCLAADPNGARGKPETITLNGVRFTRFEHGGGGMSHYLVVRSNRTRHAGRCYAIDLIVSGTDPGVYAPPRTPPFSHDQAFAQLQSALDGFHFDD